MKYVTPVLLLFLFAAPALAQEAPEKPQAEPAPAPLQLSPEEMSRQVALLGSRFYADRARAQTTIARTGGACAPHLTRALESDKPLLRMKAVELLARLKLPQAVHPIIEMLRDSSPTFRKSARRALVDYGPDILPVLNKLKESGQLSEAGLPDAILASAYREPLLELLTKEYKGENQYRHRYAEIAGLGAAAIPGLFSLLEESLKRSPNPGVTHSTVLTALAHFKDKKVIARLEALYSNPVVASHKLNIATTLALLGAEKCLDKEIKSRLEKSGDPGDSIYSSLAYTCHALGRYAGIEKWCRRAVETARAHGKETSTHLYNLACGLSLVGKHDEAVETLKTAIEKGFSNLSWMVRDKDFDPIREHPGYIEIVKTHCPQFLPKKEDK